MGHPLIRANVSLVRQGQEFVKHVGQCGMYEQELPPYDSSIGEHVRHVLDTYDCLLQGCLVDFTLRERDLFTEQDPDRAIARFQELEQKLNGLTRDVSDTLHVLDNVGVQVTSEMSLEEGLRYVFHHTTHHYAQMYTMLALARLLFPERSIQPYPDRSFGYNPSTLDNVHAD